MSCARPVVFDILCLVLHNLICVRDAARNPAENPHVPPPACWPPNRKKLALTEGKTVEGLFSELQGMVQFLARAREGKISPLLAGRLAIGLLEASEIVRIPDPLFMFFVYRAAADELSSTGSPMEVTLRYKQYLNSTRPVEGLNSSQSQMLKHVKTSGIDALRRAVELQAMFYGEEHEQTFRLRRQAESALRFA